MHPISGKQTFLALLTRILTLKSNYFLEMLENPEGISMRMMITHCREDVCESKVEIVTPYWASNSNGKVRMYHH